MFKQLSVAAIALAATPAFAGPTAAPTARVAVADLNLGTTAGIASLDRRLAAAIRKVCPAHDGDLRGAVYQRSCRAEARRTADASRTRILAQAGVERSTLAASLR